MEKEKYYVNIASGEISKIHYENNGSFTINATTDEVKMLRMKMNQMQDAEVGSLQRASIPFVPYHKDQPNDQYDAGLIEAFEMIYELGEEDTKSDIISMGILTGK